MGATRGVLMATCAMALACQPVPEEEGDGSEATSVVVIDAGEQSLSRGAAGALTVQALDAEGDPVDGARVFFLSTDTASLVFEGEGENDLVVETTAEGEALNAVLAGLASATIKAEEDAPEDAVKVVVGRVAPSTDPPGEAFQVIRLTITDAEPEGTGG